MSAHTAGPWFSDGYKIWGHRETVGFGGAPAPEYSYKIANAELHHPWKHDEQEANAVLIAAAPDLLEAALAMLNAFGSEVWFGDKAEALLKLIDAINKADGES